MVPILFSNSTDWTIKVFHERVCVHGSHTNCCVFSIYFLMSPTFQQLVYVLCFLFIYFWMSPALCFFSVCFLKCIFYCVFCYCFCYQNTRSLKKIIFLSWIAHKLLCFFKFHFWMSPVFSTTSVCVVLFIYLFLNVAKN